MLEITKETIIDMLNQQPVDKALEMVHDCIIEMDLDRAQAIIQVAEKITPALRPIFERIIQLNDQGLSNADIAKILVKEASHDR